MIPAALLVGLGRIGARHPNAGVTFKREGTTVPEVWRVLVQEDGQREPIRTGYTVIVSSGPRPDGTYGLFSTVVPEP